MNTMRRLAPVVAVGLATLVACQSSAPADGATSDASTGGATSGGEDQVTYYRDAKAILDARCATCHRPGDIAPFSLATGEDAVQFAPLIMDSIEAGTMPPWPPSDACNTYEHERSLTADERATLRAWVDGGSALGDPADAPPPVDPGPPIAWDLEVPLPIPYVPTATPDDYRCFVIDWPEDKLRYVTGFSVLPDQRQMVHHAAAFMVAPESVSHYKGLDDQEEGPGYTCFGTPGGITDVEVIAGWNPGVGPEFDAQKGIPVPPGSALIVQMHYHLSGDPQADQTRFRFKLADSVATTVHLMPFGNPAWPAGNMPIPAGDPSVVHPFEFEYTQFLETFLPVAGVKAGDSLLIHSATLHMHTRGKRASLTVERLGGDSACALHVPRWDFDWQGSYQLKEPIRVEPGDKLRLECEWDNSAANQPFVDGKQLDPIDLNWGSGSDDEMCAAVLAISRA